MTTNLNLTAVLASVLSLAAGGALAQVDAAAMTCADVMAMGPEDKTAATDGMTAMMTACEGYPGMLAADALTQLQFRDIDVDHNGLATADEFATYGDLVMVSMDSDSSGNLSEPEFTSWGFGMHNLVDAAGSRQGYDTAVRVVFDYWDHDNDAAISAGELNEASMSSFAYADTNGDVMLDATEFRDNFLLNIALRTALTAAR